MFAKDADGAYQETRHVAAVLTGPAVDFFAAKGLVEALAAALRVPGVTFAAEQRSQMHPGRCASITLAGKTIGYVAELDPDAAKSELDIPAAGRIAVFELNADALLASASHIPHYTPLPRFPAVSRDLAVVVDLATPYALLENTARAAADAALTEQISLVSVYTGERVPNGKKSVALRLTFRSPTRTLTDAEVDTQVAAVGQQLAEQAGAEQR